MNKLTFGLLISLFTLCFAANAFGQFGSATPDGLGGYRTYDGQGNRGSITPRWTRWI